MDDVGISEERDTEVKCHKGQKSEKVREDADFIKINVSEGTDAMRTDRNSSIAENGGTRNLDGIRPR